jgi:hypothetical protein
MTPEEVQKLLGGYATGTLTEAERQALFEAALHDQALFDALMREEPLRELLAEPDARAQLLAALEPPARRRFWTWRPLVAAAALAAVAAVALLVARRPKPAIVSDLALPAPAPVRAIEKSVPAAAVPAPKPRRKVETKATPAAPEPKHEQVAVTAEVAPVQPAPIAAPPPPMRFAPVAGVGGVARARLQGVVRDPAGAVIPDARVMAVNNFTSESSVASTDAAGQYVFPALRPGDYTLKAQAPGFAPAVSNLRLAPQANSPRDLTLRLGAMAEAVEVAAPPLRYSVLCRNPAGEFVETPIADLHAGDTVELRFTAAHDGYLALNGGAPVSLTANVPYTTPPLPAGTTEVKATFTQLGQPVVLTIRLP